MDFIELCRIYPSDKVASYPLAYRSQEVFADLDAEAAAERISSPVDAELALQRAQRWGSMRLGDDGMWHLTEQRSTSSPDAKSTVALQAMVRSLRRSAENTDGTANDSNAVDHSANGNDAAAGRLDANDGSASGDSTDAAAATLCRQRAQLTADAISDLIAGTTNVGRARTSLVIVADYDVVNDRLTNPRLDDGTPISAKMLADHAA